MHLLLVQGLSPLFRCWWRSPAWPLGNNSALKINYNPSFLDKFFSPLYFLAPIASCGWASQEPSKNRKDRQDWRIQQLYWVPLPLGRVVWCCIFVMSATFNRWTLEIPWIIRQPCQRLRDSAHPINVCQCGCYLVNMYISSCLIYSKRGCKHRVAKVRVSRSLFRLLKGFLKFWNW